MSCVLVGVCYLLCLIWPSRPLLLLLSVAVGLTCMCVIVIPTLLLARYHSENNTHHVGQKSDSTTRSNKTRRERLTSALYLSVKKHKVFKTFGLFETSVCCKISIKLEGGTIWRQKQFENKSHSAEKSSKGGPIVSSSFVSYVENGVSERKTLCTNLVE